MEQSGPYEPRKVSRSEFMEIRGLTIHLRHWGPDDAPPLVMLHGSRDMSATFQFVIDAFQHAYSIVAPDWRGHGLSSRNPQGYWFQDYLGDLDALLERKFGRRPVPIIGHSLGGNVGSVYAGVRPERVTRLVALDAFGLTEEPVDQTPDFLRAWLDSWQAYRGTTKAYPDSSGMADRLRAANPRLSPPKAQFLARHMAMPVAGGFTWNFDALHRLPFAIRHRRAEWEACIGRIDAPVLWIASGRRSRFEDEPGGLAARRAAVRHLTFEQIPDTSHNLHHDNPQRVAELIEDFLAAPDAV